MPLLLILFACTPTPNTAVPTSAATADQTIIALFTQTRLPIGGAAGGISAADTSQTTPIPLTNTAVPPTKDGSPQSRATWTITPRPTLTPTPSPTSTPYPTSPPIAIGGPPPGTAVPPAAAPFEKPIGVTNILLLGNDGSLANSGRTDTIIILSVNKVTKTASMLSLPRDLYVYIPDWTMGRINTALSHGHLHNYGGDDGFGGGRLLKDTVLYNFGIEIDYYVRVGFDTFKQTVNQLGAIDVVVNCPLTDWRIIHPDLDPNNLANYEEYTLETGVHEMDGSMALWYARSRRTTSDFDRNRRQQQILRAILDKGLDLNLLPQAPSLWDSFKDGVETDMPISEILNLASMAPAIRENGIQPLALPSSAMRGWSVPDTGASVLLPQWSVAQKVFALLQQPPILNRATRPPIVVEVITDNWVWYRQTAENLAWFGFSPSYTYVENPPSNRTSLTYHGDNFKGSFDWRMAWIFNRNTADITLDPTPHPANADYTITLGYDFNPCRPLREAPLSGE